jgi:hypothetical protein
VSQFIGGSPPQLEQHPDIPDANQPTCPQLPFQDRPRATRRDAFMLCRCHAPTLSDEGNTPNDIVT